MNRNVMLDLETMGTAPGAVIVAIGAVRFGGGVIESEFYQRVDWESCVRLGLRMETGTVQWWLKQSAEAREEITQQGVSLAEACHRFAGWVGLEDLEVWGNGAGFDNVLLRVAFEACGLLLPWKWWNDRCYRTVKAMHPEIVELPRAGVHHNALDDARHQALHLMQIRSAASGPGI